MLALLPDEPAGRISTRNAGAISFSATFSFDPEGAMANGPVALGELSSEARLYSLVTSENVRAARRTISCEIRALSSDALTRALNDALRSVTTYAALTESVLEARAIKRTSPTVTPVALLEELACRLWGAGLSASFGPSWAPIPAAEASVGMRGSEEDLKSCLRGYPIGLLSR
ncbi:MAG: hypothetical protein M3305_10445 [Actinomycetota bacterium]|nr:hypothetical protein [Actinomycetota bacterium]